MNRRLREHLPATAITALRRARSRPLPSLVVDLLSLSTVRGIELPNVRARRSVDLGAAFRASDDIWAEVARRSEDAGFAQNPWAVSTEDRRALAGLARYLAPHAVLEIGTHIGSSTLAWAVALSDTGGKITTVDINDVNDSARRTWERFNARLPPIETVRGLAPVEFVVSDSIAYLSNSTLRYDVIFIDGDHAATRVYRELALALSHLNDGGVVVLHDYYPRGRPLPTSESVELGPYLAVRRLVSQGLRIRVLPLGELPWERVMTCLALVLGEPSSPEQGYVQPSRGESRGVPTAGRRQRVRPRLTGAGTVKSACPPGNRPPLGSWPCLPDVTSEQA